MIMRASCGAAILAASLCAQADICRWTDATGAVHYGDHAPPNIAAQCAPGPAQKTAAPKIAPYQLPPEIAEIAADIERAERANAPILAAQAAAQARFEATLSRARWLMAHPAP